MTYESVCLADSPEIFWLLNETSGTTAADASGHSLSGTYTNTYALGAAGRYALSGRPKVFPVWSLK